MEGSTDLAGNKTNKRKKEPGFDYDFAEAGAQSPEGQSHVDLPRVWHGAVWG
jgi:hypothetical protein